MNDDAGQLISSWAKHGEVPTKGLDTLINYSREQYASHVDTFLRHKESGLRTLGTALAAEFALTGFYFSTALPAAVAITGLSVLAFLSVPITKLAVHNCDRSFRSTLEHALMTTKIAWAMGLGDPVTVPNTVSGECPAEGDTSLYPHRYLEEASKAGTTEDFVRMTMEKSTNTFFATRRLLWILGGSAVVVGVSGSGAVLWKASGLTISRLFL